MVERRKQGREDEGSAFGLSPFRDSLYRALWIATLFSYIGVAMYDVGVSWLMTSLAPNPLFVSLITTASTLPIFLFASRNFYFQKYQKFTIKRSSHIYEL